MRILEQTSNRLVMRDRAIVHWFMGSLFACVGFLPMIFGQLTTLRCQRVEPTQGQCQLTQSGLLGSESQQIQLSQLQGARVDSRHTTRKGRDRWTYQVILLTQTGELPFRQVSSSGQAEKQAIAAQINVFVWNPNQPSLHVQQDDRLELFLIGGVPSGVGVLLLLAGCKVTVLTLDQSSKKLLLKRWGLLGNQVIEHPLQTITGAELQSIAGRKTTCYRVALILSSGDRLPLTGYYSSGSGDKQRVVDAIDRFLNPVAQTIQSHSPETSQASSTDEHELEQTLAQWQATIQTNPDDAEALYRLGMALYKDHQHQEATVHLKRARDLFDLQDKSEKVIQIQDMLWRLGLE